MNLQNRIAKLEALAGPERRRPCDILFLDLDGRILWDGDEGMRGWSGRSADEWPPEWLEHPWPLKRIIGVDPLVVLGLDLCGLTQPFPARLDDAGED